MPLSVAQCPSTDYEQILVQAYLASKQAKKSEDGDKETAEEDEAEESSSDEEARQLRQKLDTQYDLALEQAFEKGFNVATNSMAGKRYVRFMEKCQAESEKYNAASAAEKKKLISAWAKGKYDEYADSSGSEDTETLRWPPQVVDPSECTADTYEHGI